MKTVATRVSLLLACLIVLTSAYQRPEPAEVIADTASRFLASLSAEQRHKATFQFQDEERLNWHFIPRERKGIPWREMTPTQQHLAHALLSAGLSQQGYIKAATVMSLEEVLRILENDSGELRNPGKYYISVFGTPSAKAVWGYRVEGHHLSLNYTLVNGVVTGNPSFFGANPAEVREGPRQGLRTLARVEDLARSLLDALPPEQQKVAIVDAKAYPDILTEASRKAALSGQPNGLSAAAMTAAQRDRLHALLAEYAGDFPEPLAQARLERVKSAGKVIHFAWAGVKERGGPHYYRVQGPTFLVEYDNTQNNANHIHSVWRDFDGDWGLDLLKKHYESAPHATSPAGR